MENQAKNNSNKELYSDPRMAEAFLQSRQWNEFQHSAGKKTFFIEKEDAAVSIIEHMLPIVGKYFYCPRGPIISLEGEKFQISNFKFQINGLLDFVKRENAGWIRIEPTNEKTLNLIKENIKEKIVRAPHDMQPKEIFVLDIAKTEEELLSEMKPKTRYNINLAKKKGVLITSNSSLVTEDANEKTIDAFLKLTKEMAKRQGINTHAEQYYRKMIESFPSQMLEIYTAEYQGEIVAANLVLFFENTAIYLHGASGNLHRNVMAPFLLQWQAILDAKKMGCKYYDFGGVQTPGVKHQKHSDLVGVTNFKLGFSPNTPTIEFPGSYDIIINPRKYAVYRGLQRAKSFAVRFKK